jgi:hypothetical protein
MADIIRPQFGKSRLEQPVSSAPVDTSPVENSSLVDTTNEDIEFLRYHMDVYNAAAKRETEAVDFIEKLEGFVPNEQDVELRRAGLKGNTLQQICEMWLSSSKVDWKSKPSFYFALVFEREMHRVGVHEALKKLPPDE